MRICMRIIACAFLFMAAGRRVQAEEAEKLNVDITDYDQKTVMIRDGMTFFTPLPVTFSPEDEECSYSISIDGGETFGSYVAMDTESITLYPDDDTSPNGRWQIRFASADGKLSDVFRIAFDTSAPQLIFKDPEVISDWLTGSTKVHFSAEDENGLARIIAKCGDTLLYEMHCRDEETVSSCEMELQLGDTGRTHNKVDVSCYDTAGNRTDTSFEYLYDDSVPVINAQGIKDGSSRADRASLQVRAEDRDSEAYICYTLERIYDGMAVTADISSSEAECVIDFDEEGMYTVRLWAEDSAGNRSEAVTKTFAIDRTAPSISITGAEESVDLRTAAQISIDVSDNVYEGTEVYINLSRTVLGKTENIPIKSYTLQAERDIRIVNINSDGEYILEVSAADSAGNEAHEMKRYRMDATAPDVLVSGMSENGITGSLPTLRFSAGEVFYSSTVMSAILERKEGDGYRAVKSLDRVMRAANDHMEIEVPEEGEYRLTCIAADRSGNTAQSQIRFTVDRTPPVIADLKDIDSRYFRSFSLPAKLSALVRDPSGYTADAYIDDTPVTESDVIIEEGKYVLTILAEDAAGNASEASASFIVDHTSPQIVLEGLDRDGNIRKGRDIKVSLAEECDRLLEVTFNDRNISITPDNTATVSADGYGQYCLAVKAEDPAGNVTDTKIHMSSYMYGGVFDGFLRTEETIEASSEPDRYDIDYAGILIGLSSVLSGTFGLAFRSLLHH